MARADDLVIVGDARGVRRVRLGAYLDAGLAEQAERDANAWVKSLRGAMVDGLPLRERFTHRGDSLWWFAELYMHKMQVANHVFRTLLALDALVAREHPVQLGAAGSSAFVRVLARRVAERDGLAWIGGGRRLAPPWLAHLRIAARAHMYRAASVWNRVSGSAPPAPRRAAVAALLHAAFWKGHEEQYVGPVLRELEAAMPAGQVALVALGPETSYKARAWHHRLTAHRRHEPSPRTTVGSFATPAQLEPSRGVWKRRREMFTALAASADLRRAAVVMGCDAWPLVEPVLMGVAYLQFPWSAQVMDELGAAFDAIGPSVAVTYAEAGGWGRAMVLEARRRGISSAGLQHGFIYRHWLNYLHEHDETVPAPGNPDDGGFPFPTRTLLYDEFAAEHLRSAGRFPPPSLAVTGSARLDTLVHRAGLVTPADMARTRRAIGAEDRQEVVVVAAKFTQIGKVFDQLVRETAVIPGVRLVVKPHPAETAAPYLAAAHGASHVAIAPPGVDLAELTRVARLLVTVNSTAAIEAMVMGVPSLVLAMPNNLTPFVEAGAMAGVVDGEAIGPALRSLLADERGREALLRRSAGFMARYRVGSDGGAARRAAEEIVRLASGAGRPRKVS